MVELFHLMGAQMSGLEDNDSACGNVTCRTSSKQESARGVTPGVSYWAYCRFYREKEAPKGCGVGSVGWACPSLNTAALMCFPEGWHWNAHSALSCKHQRFINIHLQGEDPSASHQPQRKDLQVISLFPYRSVIKHMFRRAFFLFPTQ